MLKLLKFLNLITPNGAINLVHIALYSTAAWVIVSSAWVSVAVFAIIAVLLGLEMWIGPEAVKKAPGELNLEQTVAQTAKEIRNLKLKLGFRN